MRETIYLSIAEVIALHDLTMELMGSPPAPLLHPDKLESALNRPRHRAYYEPGTDLVAQAILLAVGISQAQAFEDGNKRIAFIAADMFLATNGVRIDGDSEAFACWLICVAGKIAVHDLELVAEHLGLDLAVELDGMGRDEVTARFESWLRANVSHHDPDKLIDEPEMPA